MKKPIKADRGETAEAGPEAPDDDAAREASAENDNVVPDTAEEAEAAAAPANAEPDPVPPPQGPDEQIAELKDRLLRAMAETENLRRRAEREREEARKYAVTGLARDLVGIVDNLRRAVAAAPTPGEEGDEVLASLLAGVEMTERELLAVLERHDIRAINPVGEKFNPNYHQAMFEVPDSGQAPGTVVEVTEVGYAIAERLLRPAAVGVAAAPKEGDGAPTRIDTKV